MKNLQQRNEELAILNSIAQTLNREVGLKTAMNKTLEKTVALLQLETGWIWFFEGNSKNAQVAASYNMPPIFLEQPQLLTGECYCIERYMDRGFEIASNISEITCSRLKNLTEGTAGLRFHASVPLIAQQKRIGLLNVVSPHLQELKADKLQLLYTIGDMLSIAIERARLFENSKQVGVIQERNRLAREIHDTLAQGFTAIALKLETLETELEKGNSSQSISEVIQQLKTLAQDNLKEARHSVLDLRATPLQEHGFLKALEILTTNIQEATGIQANFEVLGISQSLPLRMEVALYRMVQEALINVQKHAKVTTLFLSLAFYPNKIIVTIEDNGQGFNTAQTLHKNFGLIGINERVKLLNGHLEIHSTENIGTLIEIEIPIK